ncbi:MAG: hypothetical protein KAT05_11135 [Spirochaetes bacterium]|nr:hypothetical protein [Spirochaetota bacterium]
MKDLTTVFKLLIILETLIKFGKMSRIQLSGRIIKKFGYDPHSTEEGEQHKLLDELYDRNWITKEPFHPLKIDGTPSKKIVFEHSITDEGIKTLEIGLKLFGLKGAPKIPKEKQRGS